jgi:uncharacterized protein YciW
VEVKRVVRYGKLLDATIEYLTENPAQRLLMGSPHPEVENYEDRLAKIKQFARQLEDKTGAVVGVVS